MMNDPNELMDYIQPFFPDDSSLAIKAVSKLFPNLPTWVSEMIVFEFFQALGTREIQKEYIKKFSQYDDILSGKSRDLKLPTDLAHPFNLN